MTAKQPDFPRNAGQRLFFQVNGQEIIMEVSVEKDVTIGIIVGDESAMWKGTLAGLQQIFRGEIKAR